MTPERPLTGRMRPDGEPLSLDEYERSGGYRALRKALRTLAPAQVTAMVSDANLRGRGGAGFPAGRKWAGVPMEAPATEKYLIANGDEMEPGTFKDRILMEGDPHQLIEGMILAAYAVGAGTGFLFVRGEYALAIRRLRRALSEAHAAGYLGAHILGADFSFEIFLHVSAGRYICGEGSALLSALAGARPIPRAKAVHATVSGLWGRPSVVNNIETLCNVPHIVENGAQWFKALSLSADGGTKIYGVSGRVRRPGAWELPMGTSLQEIIDQHAGGMRAGFTLTAVQPGGASTEFIAADRLDVPMDFDQVQQAGSRLGTGTVIVLDDRTCPVAALHNLEQFFARESCGWCTPCREGLPWVAETLAAIEAGAGRSEDMEILEQHCHFLGPAFTFCALAPGAAEPLRSALKLFRPQFERHLRERRCPWSA